MGDEHYGCLSIARRLGSKQTWAAGRVHGEFKSLEENIKPSLMISDEKIAGSFLFLLCRRYLYRVEITYRWDLPAPTCRLCYSISSTIAKTSPRRLLWFLLNKIFVSCLGALKFFSASTGFWLMRWDVARGNWERNSFFQKENEKKSHLSPLNTQSYNRLLCLHPFPYPSHMAVCSLDAIDSLTCAVRALQMTYGFSTRLTHANKTPAFKVNKWCAICKNSSPCA